MVTPVSVLYNGQVRTMSGDVYSAVAWSNGHLLALGNDDLKDLAGSGGEAIDLGGRLVLPAFTDAHLHFSGFALARSQIDLKGVTALPEAVRRVRVAAGLLPVGSWVLGRGWAHDLWGGELPTRALLDEAAPGYPVVLRRNDGHGIWASTEALRRAGVNASTANPDGGEILRDARGEPTGVLTERAMDLVTAVIPEPSHDDVVRAVEAAIPVAHRAGLAGITCMESFAAYRAYRTLRDAGRLGLRVAMCLAVDDFDAEVGLIQREGRGDENLHWTHLKIFADGALNPRTAWMLAPYQDAPGKAGISVTPPEEIARWSARAAEVGFACAVHAIGDAANRAVLDAFEATRSAWQSRRLRPRVEHAQTLAPEDVPRFASLGVIASMQPIHCTQDIVVADRALGPRAKRAYVFRSLVDSGATLAFGSDCPVETLEVLPGLYAATARRRADGFPPGGWYPDQRLTLDEAVAAYTRGAAFASGQERARGTLEPGKLADLVILSEDVFRAPPEALLAATVEGTIVSGSWAYRGLS